MLGAWVLRKSSSKWILLLQLTPSWELLQMICGTATHLERSADCDSEIDKSPSSMFSEKPTGWLICSPTLGTANLLGLLFLIQPPVLSDTLFLAIVPGPRSPV
ncbi:hypothetical protein LINPERHAP2_LOCUS1499 [Linum perenne]